MDAADRGSGLLIRGCGHRAGIQNDDLRLRRSACGFQSPFAELAFDCSAIRLRGPAAEILDIKSSHASILSQAAPAKSSLQVNTVVWVFSSEKHPRTKDTFRNIGLGLY